MDEARVLVATALASIDDYVFAELPADESPNYLITDQRRYLRMADVFVAEIEAAGYSLIATDRLERLTQAGWCYRRVWIDECDGDMECAEGNAGLHPGDLEGTS